MNLNCGCPSDRVQSGRFGACLMGEPGLVADCVKAMRDACALPVTVKHRIGIDEMEHYQQMVDFVLTVAESGCSTFIVHARKAWLQGLSPKENREIPPLHYDWVYRLKEEHPELEIVINGGISTLSQCETHLEQVDGVMLGREAYQNPYLLAEVDQCLFGDAGRATDPRAGSGRLATLPGGPPGGPAASSTMLRGTCWACSSRYRGRRNSAGTSVRTPTGRVPGWT